MKDNNKNKKHLGKIYYVDPKHLIKPSELDDYQKKKGNSNKRPVMITEQKGKKKVQVSQMTTKPPKSSGSLDRIQLKKTYPNRNSYASTRTISKSKDTKKPFMVGNTPLNERPAKTAHKEDLKSYRSTKNRRYNIK